MNIQELLKTFNKRSKKDDVPGTVQQYLDEECPVCGKKLKIKKACCSSKHPTKECVCGWKLLLE